MQELRFVAVSEDGSYAVLAVPGRSGRFILPIDERLRAVAQGQTSRLAQYEIEVESPLRPKEIQARIRAGETAEEIADAAGIPVERVRWFEGPVLAERGYIADQAQTGSVRRAGDASGPGPRLGEIVTQRLSAAGTDPADGQWDSRKRGDGNWQVSLTFPSGGRLHVAEWVFDPRRRHVLPDDDNAARLSLPESELPAEPVALPGEATVTPIASRLSAAAGMGGGAVPGVSRFRPDRSVIPDRSLGGDRSLADRPVVPERPAPTPAPPSSPAPAGYQTRAGNPGYAEFPESAPYRAPEPAPEPPAYREAEQDQHGDGDPAPASAAYRTQVSEPPAYQETAPAPHPPAYRESDPAPAAYRDAPATVPPAVPAPGGSVPDDSERWRPVPPRPVIFEEPEPAFSGEPEPIIEDRPVKEDEPAIPAEPATQAEATASAETAAPAAEPVTQEAIAVEATIVEESAPSIPEPPTSEPTAEVPAPAQSASAEDQPSRARQNSKKNPKGRRSSVPSWDEIMLGSNRQRD